MKKKYIAPRTAFVGMADDLLQLTFAAGSGVSHESGSNGIGFMDFGGAGGGGMVFN